MHLGRERPPFSKRGTSTGGWQRGSLTPQMPSSLLLTAALTATRAAQSAARCTAAKSLTRKDIDQSILQSTTFTMPRASTTTSATRRGTQLPRLCSPHFRQSSVVSDRNQETGRRVYGGARGCGLRTACEPLRGSILTRVAPSSIDRSVPGAMSSRCASSALATMLTGSSESRS